MDWAEHAACRGTDVALWYPSSGRVEPGPNPADTVPPLVAEICRGCPVRGECFGHALAHEDHGFWAATSARERRRIRKHRGIRLSDPSAWSRRAARVAELEAEAAS